MCRRNMLEISGIILMQDSVRLNKDKEFAREFDHITYVYSLTQFFIFC